MNRQSFGDVCVYHALNFIWYMDIMECIEYVHHKKESN